MTVTVCINLTRANRRNGLPRLAAPRWARFGFALALALCLPAQGQAQRSPAAASDFTISTDGVPRVAPPTTGGDPRKFWKPVVPDAGLQLKLERYRRAQNHTHDLSLKAGFAPAAISARDAAGRLTTFYIDLQDGEYGHANAFAGTYLGKTSVWFNHAGFVGRDETDNLYTIAHEFFHSIFDPVNRKHGLYAVPTPPRMMWISEGIPTAVGQLAMEGFEGTSLKARARSGSRLGIRALGARYLDYPIDLRDEFPLPTSVKAPFASNGKEDWFTSSSSDETVYKLSYATSSFWQHVATRSGGMGWVRKFIDRPAPADKSAGGWVDWAQQGVRSGRAFANFADAYNDYIGSFVDYPYLNPTSEKDFFAWGTWQNMLFHEGCRPIEVVAGAPAVDHVATIYPMAAECVRVKVTGLAPKAANVHVTLANASLAQCKNINVVSGLKRALQDPVVKPDNTCDWHWQYEYNPLTLNAKGEQVFVITNVNPEAPGKTPVVRAVTFQFSVPAISVTASGSVSATSGGQPQGTTNAYGPPRASPAKVPVPSRPSNKPGAAGSDRVAQAGQRTAVSEASASAQGSDCDALSRQVGPCGVALTTLKLRWGDVADQAFDVTRLQGDAVGGDLSNIGQMMTGLASFATTAGQGQGGTLELKFPKLKPGQTGKFSNALARLTIQTQDKSVGLESVSPKYVQAGSSPGCPHSGAVYPHAGQVTIDSHDATGLAGSFSADFHESSASGCPVPVKVASVSGRFKTQRVVDEDQEAYAESAQGQARLNELLVAKFYAMVPPALTASTDRVTAWETFAREQGRTPSEPAQPTDTDPGATAIEEPPACRCDCEEAGTSLAKKCLRVCGFYVSLRDVCVAAKNPGNTDNPWNAGKPGNPRNAADATSAVDCYLDFLVRDMEEPQKSQFRRMNADQLKGMDPKDLNHFLGPMLAGLKAQGLNCPAR